MNRTNPFAQSPKLWQATFELHESGVPALEEAFAGESLSSADFELDEGKGIRKATLLLKESFSDEQVRARLAVLETLGVGEIRLIGIEIVEPRNWIDVVKHAFPPLSIGNFYIHGSHVEAAGRAGATSLLIDANAAFGTGEHETTRGCLMALDDLCRHFSPKNALDMGCGSAILGMAFSKRWHMPSLGVEIDPVAVKVARENVRLNRLNDQVRVVVGNGYHAPEVRRSGPFDVIFANILARPLVAMAPRLAASLAPGGHAILSGLLGWQENMVLHAHRQQGLTLVKRWRLGVWSVLVMRK